MKQWRRKPLPIVEGVFANGGVLSAEESARLSASLHAQQGYILPAGVTVFLIDWRRIEIAPGVPRCPPDPDNDRERAR